MFTNILYIAGGAGAINKSFGDIHRTRDGGMESVYTPGNNWEREHPEI